jgi:hypothetical protein
MATGLFNLKQVNQAITQKAWSGTQKTNFVEYLVVAGGGGAGATYSSGGGGGGGLLTGILPVATGTSITATVGAGGAASTIGQNSVFGAITATGGGKGGNGQTGNPGGDGGSGGGAGSQGSGISAGGQGTLGQGNTGGGGSPGPGVYGAGGGGGAGTIGLTGTTTTPGAGGAGIASSINGTVTAYAGGGGAGSYFAGGGFDIAGGVGGGGTGKYNASGVAGTANTGGGGGGTGLNSGVGGAGGSGIVIVSYPDVYAAATATTGSPTVSTSGSGSMLLNGTTQSLNIANGSNLAFGTGDFTVEGWFYQTADNSYPTALEIGAHVAATGIAFITKYAGTATIYSGGFFGGTATTLNAWNHIAWVRASGVLKIYVNGVSPAGVAFTNNLTATSTVSVGGAASLGTATYFYSGNISNLRVVKGTAVYTSNFTPSTTPLTAITGTQLLMNTVSGAPFADSSANGYSPTSTTPPVWNALSPFTVTGYKNRVYTFAANGSITF